MPDKLALSVPIETGLLFRNSRNLPSLDPGVLGVIGEASIEGGGQTGKLGAIEIELGGVIVSVVWGSGHKLFALAINASCQPSFDDISEDSCFSASVFVEMRSLILAI
jgi:hypothetical protein